MYKTCILSHYVRLRIELKVNVEHDMNTVCSSDRDHEVQWWNTQTLTADAAATHVIFHLPHLKKCCSDTVHGKDVSFCWNPARFLSPCASSSPPLLWMGLRCEERNIHFFNWGITMFKAVRKCSNGIYVYLSDISQWKSYFMRSAGHSWGASSLVHRVWSRNLRVNGIISKRTSTELFLFTPGHCV